MTTEDAYNRMHGLARGLVVVKEVAAEQDEVHVVFLGAEEDFLGSREGGREGGKGASEQLAYVGVVIAFNSKR